MANPYAVFKTDSDVEVNGVILDYGDIRIRIARAGGANKKFNRLLTARLKQYKRQIDTESLDEEVASEVMIETYVDGIVLNMEVKDKVNSTKALAVYTPGILDPDGNVLEFNRTNAIAFFTNLPELFKDVQVQSTQVALFRAVEQEEEIKNS